MNKFPVEPILENVQDLRNEATKIFAELRTKQIEVGVAKELFNGIGKITNLAKVQMEYNFMMKNQRKIPWLDVPEEKPSKE